MHPDVKCQKPKIHNYILYTLSDDYNEFLIEKKGEVDIDCCFHRLHHYGCCYSPCLNHIVIFFQRAYTIIIHINSWTPRQA
jgi:hypothetical protein